MSLSFKNRIAFYYLMATAALTAVVFFIIFQVVSSSVYLHLDDDLIYEAHQHSKVITLEGDQVIFKNKAEWEEREHREVVVNPVFIQVVGLNGETMDKSPNLKEDYLGFAQNVSDSEPFDALLKDRKIRQVQVPIKFNKTKKGYLLTAMSLENSLAVLKRLQNILIFSFPVVLLLLFFITRMLAAGSIRPIKLITETADNITRNNLEERIKLPKNKDELFSLTTSINRLLDRLKEALDREKQFTADASHELRTPLTVLKGTLEVLIRKPRSQSEYIDRTKDAIHEIDRMSNAVEQLLTLARVDNMTRLSEIKSIDLLVVIDEIISRYALPIKEKKLSINTCGTNPLTIHSDPYLVDLLLENIISNAVKYSPDQGEVRIALQHGKDHLLVEIEDNGFGIKKEDLKKIYLPFFRSNALNQKEISGNGLGLAIVKKIAYLLEVDIQVGSKIGQGTQVMLRFPLTLP